MQELKLGDMSGLINYSWKRKLRKFVVLRPWVVLLFVHHFDDLTLKSQLTTVRSKLFWVTDSKVRFKLFKKFSNSSAD